MMEDQPSPNSPSLADSNEPNEISCEAKQRYDNFIKSAADTRVYRGLVLKNRLKVLLVSDPNVEKPAAGVCVHIGTYTDPEEVLGLAHLCQRMLVLASEKYPEENEFQKHISDHGGHTAAFTWPDRMEFLFHIPSPHFEEALDRFAQFFITPVFPDTAMAREINDINSEYEYYKSTDYCPLIQIKRTVSDPKHPFHRFNMGNKESLQTIPESKGIDVREQLLQFYQKWFSANIMSLIVVGKESLDDLEAMVAPIFSMIEDKSVTIPTWTHQPFPPELRRKKIYSIPIKDMNYLNIDFPVPCTKMEYKSKPLDYLIYLVGHEGPGSLLTAFKSRGWCHSLCCGCRPATCGFDFFNMQLDLTEQGTKHIDDIVTLLFQYITMLRVEGPQQWIWEEQKNLKETAFRFKDLLEPIFVVSHHVDLLQYYPMEEVLSCYSLMTEWKPDLITELLSLLTSDNIMVQIAAKAFEEKCTLTEPWYGYKYWVEDIDENTLQMWNEVSLNEELHLPSPNEFIPRNLELEECDDPTCEGVAPEIIKDSNLMRLWYKKDIEFLIPKASIRFNLISPLVNADPLNANLTQMLAELLNDGLQEYTSSAGLAGLYWDVKRIELYGLSIIIEGYDEKIHLLLEKIIELLVTFKVDPKSFYVIKEKRIRDIKNKETDQPITQAVRQEMLCLSNIRWTPSQLLAAFQDITPEHLDEFVTKFIRKVHIEGLVFGNFSQKRAIKIADAIEEKFPDDGRPLFAEELLLNRGVELDKGTWYIRKIYNNVHPSSCASIYYSCGINELRKNMVLNILFNILHERCNNKLKIEEQLGGLVSTQIYLENGTHGLRITVQSDKHPTFLEQRIEAFMQGSLEYLESMSDEDFSVHKAAVVSCTLTKPQNLPDKAEQLWDEINSQVFNFDRARVEVEQLNTVTKEELIEFYQKHFSADSPERQKLSVYVISTAEGGAAVGDPEAGNEVEDNLTQGTNKKVEIITNIADFKAKRKLFPNPKSFIDAPRKGLCLTSW